MTSIKKIESHKRPREKLWERGQRHSQNQNY